jgi:YbbR domain-containing protein
LEETIREDFLLEVIISGVPAANYTILTPVVNPSVVSLSSTGEHMDQVGKVYVSAAVNDISANYNQHLTVKVEDKDGLDISSLFSIYPATAEVIIGVTYSQPEKYVAIKPVTTGEPAAGFMVSHIIVEPATVRVFGDLAKLEELNFVETVPIDISGLKNSISQTVNIVLPPGFSLGNKNQVTVFIEIEPISEALFTKKVVNANNLGDDLSVYFDSNNITVIVSGPESFINNLVDADIVLYIDCEGLSPGVYELPLQFLLPANILLVSADPNIVRVEIK